MWQCCIDLAICSEIHFAGMFHLNGPVSLFKMRIDISSLASQFVEQLCPNLMCGNEQVQTMIVVSQ